MHLPGFWQFFLILLVVIILFGGKKLPELGSALGEGIKNFKKGIKDLDESAKVTDGTDKDKKQT